MVFVSSVFREKEGDSTRTDVSVAYEMRDCGTMMCARENIRPVILSVKDAAGEELMGELTTEEMRELRERAQDNENWLTEWWEETWRFSELGETL